MKTIPKVIRNVSQSTRRKRGAGGGIFGRVGGGLAAAGAGAEGGVFAAVGAGAFAGAGFALSLLIYRCMPFDPKWERILEVKRLPFVQSKVLAVMMFWSC